MFGEFTGQRGGSQIRNGRPGVTAALAGAPVARMVDDDALLHQPHEGLVGGDA